MTEQEEIEYHETLITMLEMIWGEGFLSPGGADEVALAGDAVEDGGEQVLGVLGG